MHACPWSATDLTWNRELNRGQTMKRREFLQRTVLAAGATALIGRGELLAELPDVPPLGPQAPEGGVARRAYGETGIHLSVIGFGGIVVKDLPAETAAKHVRASIMRGVNYFDVAPSYGTAESILGPALEPYRDRVFLACKTGRRDMAGAEEELKASLKTMRTDHFDLYQLHAMTKMEEVDRVFAADGAMATFQRARDRGLVRHLGFSAHSAEVAIALLERFPFDSILFPINFVTFYEGSFGPQVIKIAEEKGAARLALKAMALQPWPAGVDRSRFPNCWYQPLTEPEDIKRGLRFTLSQPVTAAIPPGDPGLFFQALELAANNALTPLTPQETDELKTYAKNFKPIFQLRPSA